MPMMHKVNGGQFGRAWVELLESPLTPSAKLCYVAMTSFGDGCYAGQASIARRMGVTSRDTVIKAQRELEVTGWLKCEGSEEDGRIVWTCLNPRQGVSVIPTGGVEKIDRGLSKESTQSDKSTREDTRYTPEFESFWKAYPHRDSDPKKPAAKSFARAMQKITLDALLALMAKYPWATEKRFNPMAATWLNQERWADTGFLVKAGCEHSWQEKQTAQGSRILRCAKCGATKFNKGGQP